MAQGPGGAAALSDTCWKLIPAFAKPGATSLVPTAHSKPVFKRHLEPHRDSNTGRQSWEVKLPCLEWEPSLIAENPTSQSASFMDKEAVGWGEGCDGDKWLPFTNTCRGALCQTHVRQMLRNLRSGNPFFLFDM